MAVLSLKPFIGLSALLSVALIACQKDLSGDAQIKAEQNKSTAAKANANGGVLVESICFKAIALVAGCKEGVTENIEFSGMIENRVHFTRTGNGNTNYTRHFVVKGLTGKGTMGTMLTSTGPLCNRTTVGGYTGTNYEVIGGAEMFSIHYAGTGAVPAVVGSNIFIHEGTLVFENTVTKERIVARHIIRKTPGPQSVVSMWTCGGGGSGEGSH